MTLVAHTKKDAINGREERDEESQFDKIIL